MVTNCQATIFKAKPLPLPSYSERACPVGCVGVTWSCALLELPDGVSEHIGFDVHEPRLHLTLALIKGALLDGAIELLSRKSIAVGVNPIEPVDAQDAEERQGHCSALRRTKLVPWC